MWQKKFFNNRKSLKIGFAILLLFLLFLIQNTSINNQPTKDYLTESNVEFDKQSEEITKKTFSKIEVGEELKVFVISVIDGDTFKVDINGNVETVRVIGINTPETVHPSKMVECFGMEASAQAKKLLLLDTTVILIDDPSQGIWDKYGRRLSYVTLNDGRDFGEEMIRGGFAYEYTYNLPYENQSKYKSAQNFARENGIGLWAKGVCDDFNNVTSEILPMNQNTPADGCTIKGNISTNDERIYHIEGQQYYHKTMINKSKGERWFCTEEEAMEAGWRKSKV